MGKSWILHAAAGTQADGNGRGGGNKGQTKEHIEDARNEVNVGNKKEAGIF